MFDFVIKNVRVMDGSGGKPFVADIAIKDGKIAVVGEADGEAQRVIDGSDLIAAPGFIDIHSHTDASLLVDPRAESKLTQGVTLELSGNCGFSSAPCLDESGLAELESWRSKYGIEDDWRTMGEMFDVLEKHGVGINFATLVGHANLRAGVVGLADREASPAEIAEMRRLTGEAMAQGAFGLSSGLIYPPSCYGSAAELGEMAKAVVPYGGIYSSHIRDESAGVVGAVDEAIQVGRLSGAPVQVSHHKACGAKNWGRVKTTLEMVREARNAGMDVTVDQYPYIASATGLAVFLPSWVYDGGDKAALERIEGRREELLNYLREASAEGEWISDEGGWGSVLISGVRHDKNRHYEGMFLDAIAKERNAPPPEALLDLLKEEELGVSMVHFSMCEEDIRTVMQSLNAMVGSDASARNRTGELSKGRPHPRSYGTFSRILGRYVREQNVIPLEIAIHKMTYLPAKKLGLGDRGLLREGYWADIAVFNPDTVIDKATFESPHQTSDGISYVFVNGRIAVEQGELTNERAGKVLRKGR